MHQATRHIHDHGQALRDEHAACDDLGMLTQTTRDIMVSSGGMRLLQSATHGGFQAEPGEFFEWVRAVAQYNAAAGWVAGVVGVHPWEIALVDPRLQDEIYGENVDTWVASPYAPSGRAVREGNGFRFSGRWQYSIGTDHCDWVVLGGIVVDEAGKPNTPPDVRHFFLPRGDYEIVPDSWQVMGLAGTGSKDIQIDGAFVPEYRTLQHYPLADGAYANRQPEVPLFHLPWACIFSGAIASATFGIAAGAISRYREYLETRVSAMGVVGKQDPYQQEALAEAEADLAAGIDHVDAMVDRWMDQVRRGDPVDRGQRLKFRRNQVRAVQRVLFSVDKLCSRAGSAAIWQTRPIERYWRDLRTAGTHLCDVTDLIYSAWATHLFDPESRPSVMH